MTVGYRVGIEHDLSRTNWQGDAARPLAWSAWYPCPHDASAFRLSGQFFDLGDVRKNADLAEGRKLPVVLMSHGTGGSPEGMGWLARELAEAGLVVIGAHHHGNTANEPYLPEGFLCWWERAADLSLLLTALEKDGPFAGRLDLERVSAVGFSLGAHTVLALTGAITSMERYSEWATNFPAFQGGPREMPDAATHVPRLLQTSQPFRVSWTRQSDSFFDARIRMAIALAPPPPIRAFDPATVAAIEMPVTLITGEADKEAPSRECADWLMQTNIHFGRISVGTNVGHYMFLGLAGQLSGDDDEVLFRDEPGVSRSSVHQQVAEAIVAAIASR